MNEEAEVNPIEEMEVNPIEEKVRKIERINEGLKVILENLAANKKEKFSFEDWFLYATTDPRWAPRDYGSKIQKENAEDGSINTEPTPRFLEQWKNRFEKKTIAELEGLPDGYWILDVEDFQRYCRSEDEGVSDGLVAVFYKDKKLVPIDDSADAKTAWAPEWFREAHRAIHHEEKIEHRMVIVVRKADGAIRGSKAFNTGSYMRFTYHHNSGWRVTTTGYDHVNFDFQLGRSVNGNGELNINILKGARIASQLPVDRVSAIIIAEYLYPTQKTK